MVEKFDEGLFGSWYDNGYSDWQQRKRINETVDEVNELHNDVARLQTEVRTLRGQLAQEFLKHRVLLSVLSDVLAKSGAITSEALGYRFEAAMLEATEAAKKYAAEAAARAQQVTCVRCQRQVARTSTLVTEYGTVCDSCGA